MDQIFVEIASKKKNIGIIFRARINFKSVLSGDIGMYHSLWQSFLSSAFWSQEKESIDPFYLAQLGANCIAMKDVFQVPSRDLLKPVQEYVFV